MTLETLKIRQQYRQYTLTELADVIARTIKQEEPEPDPAWQTWLVQYSLTKLRPPSEIATEKDWERWLAFVLRYIQPLVVKSRPMEMKTVTEAMQRRPELIKTLMFGKADMVMVALPAAYALRSDAQSQVSLELSADEAALLGNVRRDIQTSARTISDWSRYFLEAEGNSSLAYRVYQEFHAVPPTAMRNPIEIIQQTRKSQTEAGQKLDAYLNRALQEPADIGLVGQALGYLNEFERRNTMRQVSSRLFLWVALTMGGLLLVGSLSYALFPGIGGTLVALLCWALGLASFPVFLLMLVVMVSRAWEDQTWTNTALCTLEMLMGPIGANPDSSG